MATAKLEIDLPEGTWIRDVSMAHPETVFRVVAALPADETGVGLVEIHSSEMPGVLTAVEEADGILAVDLLQAGDDEALVQFETDQPFLLVAVRNSMIPLELPLDIRDGTATMEVTAPQSHLSELTEQLEEFGMAFEVKYLRQSLSAESLLTDRQRDLLAAATRRGYYDTPRECTLTELADELGLAKSTLSERLHRAEGKVIKEYLGDVDRTAPMPERV